MVESETTTGTGRRYARKTPEERRRERRERLLAAGLDAFGTQGFPATTIEGLCAAANVSTRTFYEEFGSREALALALHDEVNARALESVVAAIGAVAPDDVHGRAHAAVTAYLEEMTRDVRWARIALVETVGLSAEAEHRRRAAIDTFVALFELEADRLAAAGVIPSRPHRLTSIALAGAVLGLVNTWTVDDDFRVAEIADEAARIVVLAFTSP